MSMSSDLAVQKLLDLAIKKLQESMVNEIEIRDEKIKLSVRVVKNAPFVSSYYPATNWSTWTMK